MQKKSPIRMCLACRERRSQNDLIRLQMRAKAIVPFAGEGRSFYLCSSCASHAKKMRGIAKRLGVESDALLTTLKELTTDGEN